jgi:isoamylase
MTALVISQGVPMLLMGDENGRSQEGNNNAYCPDNELAWLSWSHEPREAAFLAYVAGTLRLRRELPLLAAPQWIRGEAVAEDGPPGVRWLRPDGAAMRQDDWTNGLVKALAVLLADAAGNAALVLSNAAFVDVDFILPDPDGDRAWRLRLDSGSGAIDPDGETVEPGATVEVPARSMRLYSL